jgi:collagen triple helix repeat protein
MLSSFRNHFGIPGVIAVVALVFAMLGGAYAASNDGGSGSKATASAKKGPRGPRGPRGPAGPAGPQGPAGPAGAKGDTGAAGSNGSNGAQGPAGPTGKTGATGATGAPGATGATGATGLSGFTETLPVGKTETGVWSAFQVDKEKEQQAFASASYNIPLAKVPFRNYINSAGAPASTGASLENCPGSFTEPKAKEGNLCVYTSPINANLGPFFLFQGGANNANNHRYGWMLRLSFTAGTEAGSAVGTWAVTAGP